MIASFLAFSAGLIRADHEASGPAAIDPERFEIWLRMDAGGAVENSGAISSQLGFKLTYLQEIPRVRSFSDEEIEMMAQGQVRISIDLPVNGEIYQAKFNPTVMGTEFDRSHFTRVCFQRSRFDPDLAGDRFAKLRCRERAFCEIEDNDPGWVDNCPPVLRDSRERKFFEIIPAAYAAPAAGKQGWVSPSLKTLESLPEHERVGYTRFEITSGPLPALSSATYFTIAIYVGKTRTPVFIDGWPPAYLHQSFDNTVGLNFAFGLENLNFSGAENGYEEIAVGLSFFKGNEKVHAVELVRDYAALRNAIPVSVTGEMGEAYEWKGRYVHAPRRDRYEIFITSWHTVEEVVRVRRLLDRSGLELAGVPLRGAIRPPLGNNRNYGTTVGLLRPTGQIEFTFNEQRAMALCRLLLEKHTEPKYRFIHRTTFVYEIGTGRKPGCQQFIDG